MLLDLSTESLFQMGLLPFPGQSETSYREMALKRLQRHEFFRRLIKETPTDDLLESYQMEEPLAHFQALWKIRPTWPVALFSQTGMSFLHLGALCCQRFENEDIHFIQLHPRLKHRNRFWGYRRDLILVHEMIHLLREGLDTGTFEEFIAYDTDPHFLRRILGPFFSSSWMPALFMLQLWALMLVAFSSLGLFPFFEELLASPALKVFFCLLGLSSLFPWFRFAWLSLVWQRFQSKIKSSPWSTRRRAFVLGLHEKEIKALSALEVKNWKSYLEALPQDLYKQRLLHVLSFRNE